MQEIIYKMDNWTIIKLLGGLTIVIASIIGFFSKYLLNRLSQSSSHSYNSKIESLKGDINKNNNLLTSLTQNYFSSSQKILDKKIQAYELLWTTIINIKNSFPSGISLVYQMLTYNEITEENTFEKLDKNPKIGPLLRSYEIITETSKIANYGKSLLNLKPYITDNTYKLFYTYQGLLGRVTSNFIWEFQNNKLYDWKKDEALKGILKITLTEKELNYIINIEINSLTSLIELIEYKILQDFRYSLNIKDSTNDTVEYLKDIETILNKNE